MRGMGKLSVRLPRTAGEQQARSPFPSSRQGGSGGHRRGAKRTEEAGAAARTAI